MKELNKTLYIVALTLSVIFAILEFKTGTYHGSLGWITSIGWLMVLLGDSYEKSNKKNK